MVAFYNKYSIIYNIIIIMNSIVTIIILMIPIYSNDIMTYRMKIHLFWGMVTFPSFLNYSKIWLNNLSIIKVILLTININIFIICFQSLPFELLIVQKEKVSPNSILSKQETWFQYLPIDGQNAIQMNSWNILFKTFENAEE